jgi:hypothetical protein
LLSKYHRQYLSNSKEATIFKKGTTKIKQICTLTHNIMTTIAFFPVSIFLKYDYFCPWSYDVKWRVHVKEPITNEPIMCIDFILKDNNWQLILYMQFYSQERFLVSVVHALMSANEAFQRDSLKRFRQGL